MTSLETFKDEVNGLFESLHSSCLVLNYRHHKFIDKEDQTNDEKEFLSLGAIDNDKMHCHYVSISEYINALKKEDYSLLLNDGGIVQVSFTFKEEEVIGYRFVYFPCPSRCLSNDYLDRRDRSANDSYVQSKKEGEDYSYSNLDDCIKDMLRRQKPEFMGKVNDLLEHFEFLEMGENVQNQLVMLPQIRFEWKKKVSESKEDKNNGGKKTKDYSASHVHLGFSDGRLAVSRPITVWRFLFFVFMHFYRDEFDEFETFSKLGRQEVIFSKLEFRLDSRHKKPFYIHIP